MTKEDVFLPVEMEKLEIEPTKISNNMTVDNPFIISQDRKKMFTQKLLRHSKCSCSSQKRDITAPIYKRRNIRLIKEPVLKLLQDPDDGTTTFLFTRVSNKCVQSTSKTAPESSSINVAPENSFVKPSPEISLHTLVDNCNQLKISSNLMHSSARTEAEEKRWWTPSFPLVAPWRESAADRNRAGPSCSQEALNPPCDVTIDELASYFETLVHIPKKMSSMAEMMYI